MLLRTSSILLLFVGIASAQLARDWHAVRSPNFEIVSRYETARIRPLVETLEWARAVLELNFGWKSSIPRPALVLLPDAPYDFERMVSSKHTGGFYLNAPWRDISLRSTSELPSDDARLPFYAQAWLFVNMVRLSSDYREKYEAFRAMLDEGTGTEEALKRVYGKSAVQFDNDARQWARQKATVVERLKVAAPVNPKIHETVLRDLEVQIAQGNGWRIHPSGTRQVATLLSWLRPSPSRSATAPHCARRT
jgi:hypothetical protein